MLKVERKIRKGAIEPSCGSICFRKKNTPSTCKVFIVSFDLFLVIPPKGKVICHQLAKLGFLSSLSSSIAMEAKISSWETKASRASLWEAVKGDSRGRTRKRYTKRDAWQRSGLCKQGVWLPGQVQTLVAMRKASYPRAEFPLLGQVSSPFFWV